MITTGDQINVIMAAITRAGGKWLPIYRRQSDENGVGVGEPYRVGCILGRVYRHANNAIGGVVIETPGVIAARDTTRIEGVLARGCPAPVVGDIIYVSSGDPRRILDVVQTDQVITLTLEE